MEDKDTLYAKWLNGEISDKELQAIEGTEALGDLDRVIKTVDQWAMPKYDTTAGYVKFKEKNQSKTSKIKKINWFAVSGLAASFLIIAFIGNTFLGNQNQEVFAQNGQNKNITLSDGSEISLNDGSSVEYNDKKWVEQRTIDLSGEALFNVSKGTPFIVETQNGSILVLGTQFNVRAWGENLYVECYEGKVQVIANGQETILTANEAVNVVVGDMSEKQVLTNLSPLWQNDTSRFYNENLQNVFKELERQFDIKVNMSATNRNFSGNFRHDDLQNALRSICKPLGLRYTVSQNQKIVNIE